jgi:23S rRNA (uridine2552-2'-O)-methyltransferase
VDLGCSPGSWLQYAADAVGRDGLVIGYDLAAPKVSPGPQVHTFIADVHELTANRISEDLARALGEERAPKIDVLLSDMAPKTTGIRDADQARSVGLVEAALQLALELLKPSGAFVAKVFQGRGFDELLLELRRRFEDAKALKPQATRQGSRESFLIAKGLRR